MKNARYMMSLAFEHTLAASVVIVGAFAISIISYLGLLLWAIVTDAPLGGPLALPFMILLALLGSLLSIGFVLFPITLFSHWLCASILEKPTFVQIPVATGLLIIELLVIALVCALTGDHEISTSLLLGFCAALILLVPLGAYWWTLQITDWIIANLSLIWIRLRPTVAGPVSDSDVAGG